VFAVQESNYTPRKDMSGRPEFDSCDADWLSQIKVTLSSYQGDFVLLANRNLLEIRCAVFVKRALAPLVWGVCCSSVAAGIGNIVGNKGAVLIAFHVANTSVAFVSSHLAAHQNKSEIHLPVQLRYEMLIDIYYR
jgi:hypothetical protein